MNRPRVLIDEPLFLAVDIGNSRVKLGLFAGTALVSHSHSPTSKPASFEEAVSLLNLNPSGRRNLDGAAICSVVPEATNGWFEVVERFLGKLPYIVSADTDFGLSIRPTPASSVGRDRLVNAAAAWNRLRTSCVVVSMGTATTVDIIDGSDSNLPEFLGGAIAPGFNAMADALVRTGAQLHTVDLTRPQCAIGRSTTEAIQSGLFYGYAYLVEGLVKKLMEELGHGMDARHAIFTGGWSGLFHDIVHNPTSGSELWEPNLTMEGIRLIWQRNVSAG